MKHVLDCGCVIRDDGSRAWCPTCAAGGTPAKHSICESCEGAPATICTRCVSDVRDSGLDDGRREMQSRLDVATQLLKHYHDSIEDTNDALHSCEICRVVFPESHQLHCPHVLAKQFLRKIAPGELRTGAQILQEIIAW